MPLKPNQILKIIKIDLINFELEFLVQIQHYLYFLDFALYDFSCFLNLEFIWGVKDLRMWRTLKEIWWCSSFILYQEFKEVLNDNVTSLKTYDLVWL